MPTKEELRERLAALEDALEEARDILTSALDEDEEEALENDPAEA